MEARAREKALRVYTPLSAQDTAAKSVAVVCEGGDVTIVVEPSEAVGMSKRRLERIGPAMQSYVDRGVYAGICTLIARRGRVVHSEQFGWRDKEARSPMSADTIFRLYSMTKPIVCTALMTLYEKGRCRLIDP